MESTLDKVISELKELSVMSSDDGGLDGILEVKDVHLGDPGFLPAHMYPCLTVEPNEKVAAGETMGYRIRDLTIFINVHLVAPEYFDPNVQEQPGTRVLVRTTERIENWFMRYANRTLDLMPDVRNVDVPRINYDMPPRRGTVKVKSAQVTLTVQKQYGRQP